MKKWWKEEPKKSKGAKTKRSPRLPPKSSVFYGKQSIKIEDEEDEEDEGMFVSPRAVFSSSGTKREKTNRKKKGVVHHDAHSSDDDDDYDNSYFPITRKGREKSLNKQDKLFLLLQSNRLTIWFNLLCYDHNITTIDDLNDFLESSEEKPPIFFKDNSLGLRKDLAVQQYISFPDILELQVVKPNDFREQLQSSGIRVIKRSDIEIKEKIAEYTAYSGTVYRAIWTRTDGMQLDVCIRCPKEDGDQLNVFLEEAIFLSSLDHENIIKLHGVIVFGKYVNTLALVVDFGVLGSLYDRMEPGKITSVRTIYSYACQITKALEYLEDQNKPFKAVLPPFVYVFPNQKIKIGGFTFNWYLEHRTKSHPFGTEVEFLVGTERYDLRKDLVYTFGQLLRNLYWSLPTDWSSNIDYFEPASPRYWQEYRFPDTMRHVIERCTDPLGPRPSIKELVVMLEQSRPMIVTATADFTAQLPIQMSFKKGEVITVMSSQPRKFMPDDMWFGQKADGVFGFFNKRYTDKASIDETDQVPAEILARGPEAEHAYRKALLEGKVQVYRGRIMLIGQDRAGKTSLKKSLFGIPFDPSEVSTEGIEVDPSTFEVDVEQVSRWQRLSDEIEPGSQSERALVAMIVENLRSLLINKEEQAKPVGEEDLLSRIEREEVSEALEDAFKELSLEKSAVQDDAKVTPSTPQQDEEDGSKLTDRIQVSPNISLQLSERLKRLIAQHLRDSSLSEKRKETVLDVWDFAGQHLYYATHPVFFSSRAVYVLTHNLSKNLNERAEPCMRQGVADIKLDNANNETNLENLISWLVTVHCIQSLEERDKEAELLSDKTGTTRATKTKYLRPPVLIVGTHADQPCVPVKQAHALLAEAICGKTYDEHVIRPFFSVDNTKSSDDQGIQDLKTKIANVLESEPYMGETLPAKWFNFEKAIAEQIERNVYFLPLSEVRRIAQTECFIIDDQEVNTMLNFYHDLRVIVKHAGTVVLQSQWLINLFKKLITVRTFDHMDPTHAKYWKTLEKTGTLHQSLIDHVFGEIVPGNSQAQQDLLSMMERYGLIARLNAPDENSQQSVQYFVPAQLTSSPESLTKACPKDGDPCPLLIHFPDGFVPHGLFPQLVSRLIVKFSELGFSHKPKLHRNGARFFIGPSRDFDLYLVCCKRYVKATLTAGTPTALQACNVGLPKQVRMLLEDALSELSREWDWLERMSTELCVLCCACAVEECEEHSQVECPDEGCGHVISVEERPLVCENVSERARLVAPGLERWFDDEHVDETCECVPKTGQPSREDLVLLADDIGVVWERLGRALGLKDSILEQLKADESKLYERCYGMLERWNQTQGASATFENLGQALLHSTVLRRDLARKYCGMVTV